jgi:hypothetical protein
MKNDLLGGTRPYIRHHADFIETTFGHVVSLQATGETDIYTISGLDSSAQPLSIPWEVVGYCFKWFDWFSWYKSRTKNIK